MASLPSAKFAQRTIEKSLNDLPPLPTVVGRVLAESSKQDVSPNALENIIASDQALTSKVLRVVNSAYYGLPGQVSSLGQACVILGIQQIRNLVLSVSAMGAMTARTDRQREAMRMFWLHSFGTAAAAQTIGKRKKMPSRDCETLFVAGLLHDIGRLFLFCNFTQIYDEVLNQAATKNLPIQEAEKKLLGLTHGEIGSQMTRLWKLPEVLSTIIEHHEGPLERDSDAMLYAVHIGDAITKHLYVADGEAFVGEIDPLALAWLEATDEEFAAIEEETNEKVAMASEAVGLMAA